MISGAGPQSACVVHSLVNRLRRGASRLSTPLSFHPHSIRKGMGVTVGDRSPGDGPVERPGTDWMWELAAHYERMRRAYPDHELCIVFDIDGTILDLRYLVVYALLAYDRAHDTEYFQGLRATDVHVHENRIDEFLEDLALPAPVRADVLAWYAEHLWSPEAILAANQPYQGVLGVIRWFQLQPATCVALNTGRPEEIRDLTLQALNALGKAYRVRFRSDLLCMNPHGWGSRVVDSKVACIRMLQERGLRVVAVVDNEPAAIQAMATADQTHEILFLHADTIFESQRVVTPRTVRGSSYGLAELVSEEELRRRVQFVWHGVNDEANLRQFPLGGVRRPPGPPGPAGAAARLLREEPVAPRRAALPAGSLPAGPPQAATLGQARPERGRRGHRASARRRRRHGLRPGLAVVQRVHRGPPRAGDPAPVRGIPASDHLGPRRLPRSSAPRGPRAGQRRRGHAPVLGGEPLVAGLADARDQGADGPPRGSRVGGQRLRRPRPRGVPGGFAAPAEVGDGRLQLPRLALLRARGGTGPRLLPLRDRTRRPSGRQAK